MSSTRLEYRSIQTIASTLQADASAYDASMADRLANLEAASREEFEVASTVTNECAGLTTILDTLARLVHGA